MILILGIGGWFRQIHVASVPASLLQPFGKCLILCKLLTTAILLGNKRTSTYKYTGILVDKSFLKSPWSSTTDSCEGDLIVLFALKLMLSNLYFKKQV